MRNRIRHESVGLRLASRAGRRRHRDQWQQRLDGPSVPPVVRHRSAVGQDEVDALGAVDRTATAQTDEPVEAEGRSDQAARLHHGRGWVLGEVVKGVGRHTRGPQQSKRLGHIAGLSDPSVRHHQHIGQPEVTGRVAELRERTWTGNQ